MVTIRGSQNKGTQLLAPIHEPPHQSLSMGSQIKYSYTGNMNTSQAVATAEQGTKRKSCDAPTCDGEDCGFKELRGVGGVGGVGSRECMQLRTFSFERRLVLPRGHNEITMNDDFYYCILLKSIKGWTRES